MRLPSSGISDVEDMLPMPHVFPGSDDGAHEEIEECCGSRYNGITYVAQLFLRKTLNKIHHEIYRNDYSNQTVEDFTRMLVRHETILDQWRAALPTGLSWKDDDPLPSDILEARLRAKYWGAKYLVTRPFLDYALHVIPHIKDGQVIETVARDCNGSMREKAEISIFKAIERMGEDKIWDAVRSCVEAAMLSTIAFDGVTDRLVLTNIHGTAHAVFAHIVIANLVTCSSYLLSTIPRGSVRSSTPPASRHSCSELSCSCAVWLGSRQRVRLTVRFWKSISQYNFGSSDNEHVFHGGLET